MIYLIPIFILHPLIRFFIPFTVLKRSLSMIKQNHKKKTNNLIYLDQGVNECSDQSGHRCVIDDRCADAGGLPWELGCVIRANARAERAWRVCIPGSHNASHALKGAQHHRRETILSIMQLAFLHWWCPDSLLIDFIANTYVEYL